MSKAVKIKKQRAFLKWAGGKFNLIESINQHLPDSECLVEPFVGAASVFLNTKFDRYILNDINADLIDMYKILQTNLKLSNRFLLMVTNYTYKENFLHSELW